jgi:hypothetical protein
MNTIENNEQKMNKSRLASFLACLPAGRNILIKNLRATSSNALRLLLVPQQR